MPELPEVETVARGLAGRLAGMTLTGVDLRRGDVVLAGRERMPSLAGRTVTVVRRRGKNVLIGFGGPAAAWLRVNLGMTGRLYFAEPGGELLPHTHLRLHFGGGKGGGAGGEVHFRDPRRFGGVWLLEGPDPEVHEGLKDLGPEPLEVAFPEFRRRLRGARAVKTALLDQRLVAGVGNIYADEALHRAGLHPCRTLGSLTEAEAHRLWTAVRRVLQEAIDCGGSTIRDYISSDGAEGSFQFRHRVYGREGEPCRRCKSAIVRLVLTARSAHYCPQCQPDE
jgi:formamidopyrimidine-DNA glycosylase